MPEFNPLTLALISSGISVVVYAAVVLRARSMSHLCKKCGQKFKNVEAASCGRCKPKPAAFVPPPNCVPPMPRVRPAPPTEKATVARREERRLQRRDEYVPEVSTPPVTSYGSIVDEIPFYNTPDPTLDSDPVPMKGGGGTFDGGGASGDWSSDSSSSSSSSDSSSSDSSSSSSGSSD